MSGIRPPELLSLDLARHDDLPDWLVLRSRFRRHETLAHASPGWILLACPQGLDFFETPGWQGPVPANSLLCLPPELVHRDRAGWQHPCRILVVYLPSQTLPPSGLSLIQDKARLDWLEAWCKDFAAGAPAANLVQGLQAWHEALPQTLPSPSTTTPPEIPSLDSLAHRLGLSKAAALRAFRRQWGCTPDQYRRQRQLRQAAELLAQGRPVVEAALEAGFWDQSHLSRHFIGIYGVTPGEFRQRNSVQDATASIDPD